MSQIGDEYRESHWSFDKRIPLAIVFTLFVQTMGGVWIVAQLFERVESIETTITDFNVRLERLRTKDEAQSIRDEILTGQISNIGITVKGIENDVSQTNTLLREFIDKTQQ